MLKLEKAVSFAMLMYEQQRWPDGTLKIMHPLQVLAEVGTAYPQSDENTLRIAVLHDIAEDFPERFDAIRAVAGDIAYELDILTRRPGKAYWMYIDDIMASGNRRALLVKLCDLLVNLRRPGLTESHIKRYTTALQKLTAAWEAEHV